MTKGVAGFTPYSFQFRFPGKRCAGDFTTTIPDYYISSVPTSSLGLTEATSPVPKFFNETALALYVDNTVPTNQVDLDSLARQLASDYVAWLTAFTDRVYNGVLNTLNSPIYDEIITEYSAGDISTRLFGRQADADPGELSHHDPANSGCTSTTNPGVAMLMPGLSSGSSSSQSIARSIVYIENGRLIQKYYNQENLSCGCSGPPPCNGTVQGNVKTPCNLQNLQGATVKLLASDGSTVLQTTTTDSSGNYSFSVNAGNYYVSVSKTNFTTSTSNLLGIACPIATVATYNVTLALDPHGAYANLICCRLCTDYIDKSKPLYFIDVNGTWTLTWSSECTWTGVGTTTGKTIALVSDCLSGTNIINSQVSSINYNITVILDVRTALIQSSVVTGPTVCDSGIFWATHWCQNNDPSTLLSCLGETPTGPLWSTGLYQESAPLTGTCDSTSILMSGPMTTGIGPGPDGQYIVNSGVIIHN